MEWQLMAHACFHSNLPVATAYASLGKKGLSHALSQTESRALFTHASLFKTVSACLLVCVCTCVMLKRVTCVCGDSLARAGIEEPQEV
jgi:long-chain acyl-CoA synthetase